MPIPRAKPETATAAGASWAQDILRTWFDELDPADWYRSSDEVDAMLRDRFEEVLEREGAHPADRFMDDPETALAAIILFDQIPRNIYRASAKAFAWDPLARQLSNAYADREWCEDAAEKHCQFALMPLMHSEVLADQQRSLELFARYAPGALEFAQSHHTMIERFGRFPHRNELLGRETTAEEADAIAQGFSW